MKQFSTRLISLRKEKGLTQAELAKVIAKQRSTVSGYETEGKEPDFNILCTLSKYFEVTTDYLLGKSDSRTHTDVVFHNDNINFKRSYDSLPPELKKTVAVLYDNFYLLLNRDMKFQNVARIELYGELLSIMQSSRGEIRKLIENKEQIQDPAFFSSLMLVQSNLKNEVSALLDRLVQEDLNCSQSAKIYRAAHSKNNTVPTIIENGNDIINRLASAPAVKKEKDL